MLSIMRGSDKKPKRVEADLAPAKLDSISDMKVGGKPTSATSAAVVDRKSRTDPSKWTVRESTQDCGIIPTLAVSLWLGWMGFLIYAIVALSLLGSSTAWATFLGLCTLSLVLPRDFPAGLGKKFGGWMCQNAERYFGLKTVLEDADALTDLPKTEKAAIFAFEPHDILPYPVFAFNSDLSRVPGFQVADCECLMTSAVFRIPFLRQIYTYTGCSPVDRATFRSKLDRKESFVFCPGGVQEVTLMDPEKPDDLILYLKSRKGFVKMALATGSPIVPTFGFHTDGSYGYWIPRGSLMNRMARSIGFLPLFFWGRFGLPFGIPRAQNSHVVVGTPIHIPNEGEDVREESVVKYHALFVQEMEALFERHKHGAGYGHRTLKIL